MRLPAKNFGTKNGEETGAEAEGQAHAVRYDSLDQGDDCVAHPCVDLRGERSTRRVRRVYVWVERCVHVWDEKCVCTV